ncbi:hypothetical protein MHBO_002739, partial [Bonamia ostreae]
MVQQKESSFLQDVFTKLQNAKSNDYSIKTRAENLETLQDAFRSNPFRHLLEIYYEKIKKELSILIDDPNFQICKLTAEGMGYLTICLNKRSLGNFFFEIFNLLDDPNATDKESVL